MDLRDNGDLTFYVGQVTDLIGDDTDLKSVYVNMKDKEFQIPCDILMPFFGLTMSLGPLVEWQLELAEDRIAVNTETFQTNLPGIYAVCLLYTSPSPRDS